MKKVSLAKSKKWVVIPVLVCVCLFGFLLFECRGLFAIAGSKNKWTTVPAEISSKDTSQSVGTDANPFVILEIVPEHNAAQIGYMIPGCEPVDIKEAMQDDEGRSQVEVNLVSQGVVSIGEEKKDNCHLEDIPYGAKIDSWGNNADFLAYVNQYRPDLLVDSSYKNFNQWHITQDGAESYGYYEKVESGQGPFKRTEDGEFTYAVSKESGSGGSVIYEDDGCYVWVQQDFPVGVQEGDEVDGKVWKTRRDSYKFDITKNGYRNNDVFIKGVFGTTSDEFQTQVLTLTTKEIEDNPQYRQWIDKADLITIHDSRAQGGTARLWNKMNGIDENQGVSARLGEGDYDLGYETTMKIMERMSSSEPAALILDSTAMFGADNSTNVHKLYLMLMQFEPSTFMQIFGEKNDDGSYKYLAEGTGGKVVYQPEYMNTPITAWDNTTFSKGPKTENKDLNLTNLMRFDNVNNGSYNVADYIYTFQGDKSMFQDFASEDATIGDHSSNKDGLYHTQNITSDAFDYYEYVDGERPDKITNFEAVRYILRGLSYKPRLRILEVQPCNKFIYDGAKGKDAAWKKYYKSIFPWYKPSRDVIGTDKENDWMDDKSVLQITTMTTQEFICSVGNYDYNDTVNIKDDTQMKTLLSDSSDDLLSRYDLIIFGSNQDDTNGLKGYNDSKLGKLLYTSVGDLLMKDQNAGRNRRLSGNDITLKKLLEVQDFLKAGKPVVFDENLYKISGNSLTVDTAKVDKDSKIYQLMKWADTSKYKGDSNIFIHSYIDGDRMKSALGYDMCTLNFYDTDSYPTEYGYTAANMSGATGVIQNETYMQKSANGRATMKFCFWISGSAANQYAVYLHLDSNGDGVYGKSIKEQAECMNMNIARGYGKEEDYTTYEENSDSSKVYTGWVAKEDNHLSDKASRLVSDEDVLILQLYDEDMKPVGKKNHNYSDEVLLQPNKKYYAVRELNPNQQGIIPWKLEVHAVDNPNLRSSAVDYTAVRNKDGKTKINVLQMNIRPDMHETTKKISSNTFATFTSKCIKISSGESFDPTVDYTSEEKTADMNSYTPLNGSQKSNVDRFRTYLDPVNEFDVNIQFMYNSDWYQLFGVDETKYKKGSELYEKKLSEWEEFLTQYDMIVYGFQDSASLTNDNLYNDGLNDFIAQGKSLIFSHDMVSDKTFGYLENYTPYFRTISGQRRAYYNLKNKKYVKSYTKTTSNGYDIDLLSSKSDYNSSVGNEDADNAAQNIVKLKGGWPDGSDAATRHVRLVNHGQITNYPYQLGDTIAVQQSHVQNHQLNMEFEEGGDVNVWFNLAEDKQLGKGKIYSQYGKDGRNDFYIYNKGNLTYTGSGHGVQGTRMSDEEIQLFVNTMIAAYRPTQARPVVEIENADAVGNNGAAVIYLDYDENAQRAVDGKVKQDSQVTQDSGYVDVILKVSDFSTKSFKDKNFWMMPYKYVKVPSEADPNETVYEYVEDDSIAIYNYVEEDEGYSLGSKLTKNSDHDGCYKISASDKGKRYIMRVPYSYLSGDGEYDFRIGAYAEYTKEEKTAKTPTGIADGSVMYLPLFDLN